MLFDKYLAKADSKVEERRSCIAKSSYADAKSMTLRGGVAIVSFASWCRIDCLQMDGISLSLVFSVLKSGLLVVRPREIILQI